MYAKIETERFQFVRGSQGKVRAENYKILHDAVQADGDPSEFSQRVILPASFTMIYNLQWQESQLFLFLKEQATDQNDIIS